jgi:hypothetical protein
VAQDWPHVDLRKTRKTGTQEKRERCGREEGKEEEWEGSVRSENKKSVKALK